MNALIVLASLLTLESAGYGALVLLVPKTTRFNFLEQLAISWLLGSGIVSFLLWLLGFVLQNASLPLVVSVICLTLGLLGWQKRLPVSLRLPRDLSSLILAFVLIGQVTLIIYLSFVHTLGWDGLFNWEIKARYAFANGGILPASYFRDSGRMFSHPEYPLAIPFTELWIYLWLGESNQFWAKSIFPIFYFAGVTLLLSFTSKLTGRSWLALLAGIFLFFVPQISVEGGSAVVGYVDFPLSVFYLATIGSLICALHLNDEAYLRVYCTGLAFLPWIKREGLILWVIAAFCGIVAFLWMKKPLRSFLLLLPGILIIAAWQIYLRVVHAVISVDFLPANFENLRSHVDRVWPLLQSLFAQLADLRIWGLFWIIVAFGCGYLLRRPSDRRASILLLALVLPIVLYLSTYLLSNWSDYLKHVDLSLDRLLMHVTPLGLVIAALAASNRWPARVAAKNRIDIARCTRAEAERMAPLEFV